jgi:hypothetical protein
MVPGWGTDLHSQLRGRSRSRGCRWLASSWTARRGSHQIRSRLRRAPGGARAISGQLLPLTIDKRNEISARSLDEKRITIHLRRSTGWSKPAVHDSARLSLKRKLEKAVAELDSINQRFRFPEGYHRSELGRTNQVAAAARCEATRLERRLPPEMHDCREVRRPVRVKQGRCSKPVARLDFGLYGLGWLRSQPFPLRNPISKHRSDLAAGFSFLAAVSVAASSLRSLTWCLRYPARLGC